MAFHVVEFQDGLGLVPTNWMTDSKSACFYPLGYSKSQVLKAVSSAAQPALKNATAKWTLCDIVRYYASADTFEKGMDKLKLAETTSDIDTDREESVKRSRHSRCAINFDTSDEEPQEPQKRLKLDGFPDASALHENISSCVSSKVDTTHNVLATFEVPVLQSLSTNQQVLREMQSQSNKQTQKCGKYTAHKLQGGKIEAKKDMRISHVDHTPTNTDDNILETILKKQNKLMVQMKTLEEVVTELKNAIITNNSNNVNIQTPHFFNATSIKNVDGRDLFVKNLEELKDLETALNDEQFFQRAGEALCSIGGNDVKCITRNVLFALIANHVAVQYSWAGREKKAFHNLNITKLIKAVVCSQKVDARHQEIEDIMTKWLIQATLRCKREKSKDENKTPRADQCEKGDENI